MKKFFNGLLILILLVVIFGGVGYIGYNYMVMNPTLMGNGQVNNQQTTQVPTDNNSMPSMPGMTTVEPTNPAPAAGAQVAEIAGLALKNKDELNNALASLNEAIEFMTLDPYSTSQKNQDNNSMATMPGMNTTPGMNITPAVPGVTQPTTVPETATQAPSVQGNTTINIYPQPNSAQSAPANTTMQSGVMADMGTTYDPIKMEQLHSGLYKLSLGMQLLDQLGDEFAYQAETAAFNIQNLSQYYSIQYTTTLQNKSNLNQASLYINEAANLVNINPYISNNGLVYDQERMLQLHESVFKLADGVASLTKLDNNLTKQAIAAATAAQGYMNAANNAQMNMVPPATEQPGQMPQTGQTQQTLQPSNLFGDLFKNLSVQFIVNAILVVFVTAFILGILGFIFSLLKSPNKKQQL